LTSKNSFLLCLQQSSYVWGSCHPRSASPLPRESRRFARSLSKKIVVHPARVGNDALLCLERASRKLKDEPRIKLVLVGISHPLYDHEDADRGMEREGEDMSGKDIRFSDVASYRAVNTKDYLTHWLAGTRRGSFRPRTSTRLASGAGLHCAQRCRFLSQLHAHNAHQRVEVHHQALPQSGRGCSDAAAARKNHREAKPVVLSFAWRVVIAAEMVGVPKGIGYMLTVGRSTGRTEITIITMLIVGFLMVMVEEGRLQP